MRRKVEVRRRKLEVGRLKTEVVSFPLKNLVSKTKLIPLLGHTGVLLFLLSFSFNLKAEEIENPEVEIGIVEHLEDILPLETWLFNEDNDTVLLKDLINKPTVLNFVYFDCPGICSPLMAGVSDVVSKLDLELGTDYQVLTISFNTKDSPEKAREKKENFVNKISKENQKHWMYLTGTQENIDALTNATGFRYKIRGNDFDHIGALILISPSGKITRYLYGAGQSGYSGKSDGMSFLPFDLKMAIIEAQNEQARETVSKLLAFCFAYDTNSKTYQLQITRIVASISIAIALTLFITLMIKGRKRTTTT